MKGKLITFEGCEGSGKSTQIRLLLEFFDKSGVEYTVSREPGGTKTAEKIREMILYAKDENISDECEALLYAAARAQHVKEVILPALSSGKTVVIDRYVDSSMAYQGYARGLGEEYIKSINANAYKNCLPDITLFLDISPDKAFERKHGADQKDRIESLGLEFHMRVYEGYKRLLKEDSRICAVECGGSKIETHQNILSLLKNRGII